MAQFHDPSHILFGNSAVEGHSVGGSLYGFSLYAKDILRSGETILDFIREGRRDRVSIDMATKMPLEILSNILREKITYGCILVHLSGLYG